MTGSLGIVGSCRPHIAGTPQRRAATREAGTKPGGSPFTECGKHGAPRLASPSVQAPVRQMNTYWKLWTDALSVGLEARRVIAMRVARISRGGATADAECRRMVSEKFAAAAAARAAGAAALAAGKGIDTAAALALAPVMRTVRANHRRLSRAKRIDGVVLRLRSLLPGNFGGHRR